MPIEPKGTRPISTLRPERRSQASEPSPTPTEKIARSAVTLDSPPCSTFFANSGNCERNSAPYSQNQEMPRIERYTTGLARIASKLRQVSRTGFGSMVSAGSAAPVLGMNQHAAKPASATATPPTAAAAAPAASEAR